MIRTITQKIPSQHNLLPRTHAVARTNRLDGEEEVRQAIRQSSVGLRLFSVLLKVWGQTEFVRTRRLARLSSIWLRLSSEEMRMDRLVEEQEQNLWGPGGYPGCPLIRCEAVLSRCEVVLRGYENEVKQIKTKNNYTWFIFKKKLKARFKNRARYSKTMIMSIKEKPRRSPE